MVQRELFLVEPQATALAETQKLITQYAQTRKCRDRALVCSLARLHRRRSPSRLPLHVRCAAAQLTNSVLDGCDLHAIAGTLKAFLRHAEPIFPFSHYDWFLKALRKPARPALSPACLPRCRRSHAHLFRRFASCRATAAFAGGAVLLPSARHLPCGDPGMNAHAILTVPRVCVLMLELCLPLCSLPHRCSWCSCSASS